MLGGKEMICECGVVMVYKPQIRLIKYDGFEDSVLVTGWWCSGCDDGILAGEELVKYNRELHDLKVRVSEYSPT
jgi:hypothetical protein